MKPLCREQRLQLMSQKQQVTHLFESDSERDHRLHCLSTNQLLRGTANESSLQNSSRLEQLSTNQQQRLADETPLQRETRLSQGGTGQDNIPRFHCTILFQHLMILKFTQQCVIFMLKSHRLLSQSA